MATFTGRMTVQDVVHQTQDVFDHFNMGKSSTLLPVHQESKNESGSVLTNIPPPSVLPMFLTTAMDNQNVMSNTQALPPPPPNMQSASPSHVPMPPPASQGQFPTLQSAPAPPPLTPQPQPFFPNLPSASSPILQPSSSTQGLKMAAPIISQPPSSSNYVKGHYRHHSLPLYPCTASNSNPMYYPSHSTSPSLVIHSEVGPSDKKLHHSTDNIVGPNPYSSSQYSSLNNPQSFSYRANKSSDCIYNLQVNDVYPYNDSSGVENASASLNVESSSPNFEDPQQQGSWLGWFKGTVTSVGSKVAEKAKTSMDSMITTLDPQMKEFISYQCLTDSGGDIDIFVASDKEVKVGAVREAFQFAFGKATVSGLSVQAGEMAAQPVGFEAVLKSAEGRINNLRSAGQVHPQQPIVAVENFIAELSPDCWYDLGLLLLDDPWHDIMLQTYTQVTPIPSDYISEAKQSTPMDYAHSDTGFSTTIGQIASKNLQVHHSLWQETLCGVSRREMIVLAARSLAGMYKIRLPQPQYEASNNTQKPQP